MSGAVVKELLSGSSRRARERADDDLDDVLEIIARLIPGKATRGGGLVESSASVDHEYHRDDEQRDGAPLPEQLARRLAAELGFDLRDVRVHTGERAARAAAAIAAEAFAIGNDLYFAAGAYQPDTEAGVALITREVAHIARAQGSTRPERSDDERKSTRAGVERGDPGSLVDHMRASGRRIDLPFVSELEEHFGTALDYVEVYTGEAAELACRLMAAGAFAVRNVVALADASPQRDTLMHELTHVIQSGGRSARAPASFGAGSLGIGAAGTAVEREASMHVAQPTVRADLNTVHRDTGKTNDKPADPARVATFAATLKLSDTPDKGKLRFATMTGERATARFYAASEPFTSEAYATKSGGTKADLDKVLVNGTIDGTYRLHLNNNKYVISRADVAGYTYKYEKSVIKIAVHGSWSDYKKAFDKIAEKRKIDFTWTNGSGGQTLNQDDPFLTNEEFEDYRRAMRDAVAEAYKNSDGAFSEFYKEVVQGTALPIKTKGTMFEQLVAKCANNPGVDGAAATSAIPVWDKRSAAAAPILAKHKKKRLDGDGVIEFEGEEHATITEAKAYAKGGGPTSGDKTKMRQYFELIESHVPGFVNFPNGIREVTFNHVFYNIGAPAPGANGNYAPEVKAVLQKWLDALGTAFGAPAEQVEAGSGDLSAKKYSLHPPPDGTYVFKVKFNPELQFEVPPRTKVIELANPRVKLPGLQISHIKAQVDDQNMISSGEVTYGIDAGDLKKTPQTKPLTPNKDGVPGGQVDNKVEGVASKLTEILPVDISAEIVDGGVKAKLALKQGATKGLAGFVVDAAEITATYMAAGSLSVDSEISLRHESGKISAKVKLGYAGGWTFEGKVSLAEGMIPGVSKIDGITIARSATGEWRIGADSFEIEQKIGAVTVTGRGTALEYNVQTGMFKGDLDVDADLGMFGKAGGTASIENNKLAKGSISYDSPAFKYPAKSSQPAFTGTVGGTLHYNNGKLSGDIRGTANIAVPALKKIAGDKGVALDVDGHIDEAGGFSGTVRSANPLQFGKNLQIPSLSCTIEKDGSLSGEFAIKVVNIKHLDNVEIACAVNKDGITIKSANVTVSFGNEEKGKFWGSLTAGYSESKGLDVGGIVNYKIKDDMVATGTLKYDQAKNTVDLEAKVAEIKLIDKTVQKTLFKAAKQIPVVNVYGLGIYVDIGFDLGFDFGFKVTTTPKVKFHGLSLETWKFDKIAATLSVGGDVFAQLTGTPKLGIGVFALDPSIIRGGGGLKAPIVGRLDIKPAGEFGVDYKPDGGVGGSAKLGLAAQFGITGSLKPYAEFSVLNDMWNPKWEGEALASFEILKPKELFNFTVDLAGGKEANKEGPKLPEANAAKAPSAPAGDKAQTATPGAAEERGGAANKAQPPKQGEVAENGDQGPFSLDSLLGQFQSNPNVATATKIFNYAKKVWKVVKPIFDVIEPIVDLIGKRIEAIIDLFDIETPTGDNLGPWLFKLAGKLFNVAFGGLADIANAIRVIFGAARAFAQKLISKAIKDGKIGVKRHSYYVWRPWPLDNYEFMAASEYKVILPGVADLGHHGPVGVLAEPDAAVAFVLYQALESVGIGYSYVGKSSINQPYNDIWYGSGARG